MRTRQAALAVVTAGLVSVSGSAGLRTDGSVVAASAGVASAQAKPIQIAIANIAFAPTEIKATVGDTIEWVNKDIVDHTATAKNKAWNLTVPSGKKASVVLKAAGTIPYFCEYHPNMTGQVVVAAKPSK